MTKNKAMRLGSVMLVLALLTTCAISGTFAKYVTSQSASDTARVAKWGVTITKDDTATTNGFQKTYLTNDSTLSTTYTNSVEATEDAVAPGTTGTIGDKYTLSGTPEVLTTVGYSSASVTLSNWEVDSVFYCPLEVTVGTTTIKGSEQTSASDMQTAIQNAINAQTETYAAKTDLSGKTLPQITWTWAYTGNDDTKDTALGNATNAATISVSYDISATQVD